MGLAAVAQPSGSTGRPSASKCSWWSGKQTESRTLTLCIPGKIPRRSATARSPPAMPP
ncbi:hypothetical protein JHY03_46830 [Streptomyces sp. CA-256286]|nr:hypothetical protein JHY03_46830 [Streptomyces sp. CA-256286]